MVQDGVELATTKAKGKAGSKKLEEASHNKSEGKESNRGPWLGPPVGTRTGSGTCVRAEGTRTGLGTCMRPLGTWTKLRVAPRLVGMRARDEN